MKGTKKDLTSQVERLSKQVAKLEVEKHRRGFIHVEWASIGRLLLSLLCAGVTGLHIFATVLFGKFLQNNDAGPYSLFLAYPTVVSVLGACLTAYCTFGLVCGGFKKISLEDYPCRIIISSLIVLNLMVGVLSLSIWAWGPSAILGAFSALIITMIRAIRD